MPGLTRLLSGVEEMTGPQRTWRYKLAFMKQCLGRGQTYMSDFKNIFLVAMGFKVFGFSVEQGFILGAATVVVFVFIGYLDLKHGIWKTEQDFSLRETNTVFKNIEEGLRK
jgi:hypothetical protein